MSTVKFSEPNWAQKLIAKAIGLEPAEIVVRTDSEDMIVLLAHKTRVEYIVNKVTGKVTEA